MGLFKKKEEPNKCSRRLIIIIEIIVAVLLFLTLLGLKWLFLNVHEDSNIVKLDNQVVNDVSFVDFQTKYENNKGEVSVSAINYLDKEITIPSLKIRLYSSDNSLVSQIEINEPIVLDANQEHLIENTIATNTKVARVEYVIE